MNEWTSGMNTDPGMWEFLSELLDGEKLPESLNNAIYALRNGDAAVVPKIATAEMIKNAVVGDPLSCDVPDGDEAMIYGRVWDFMLSASDRPKAENNANTPTG